MELDVATKGSKSVTLLDLDHFVCKILETGVWAAGRKNECISNCAQISVNMLLLLKHLCNQTENIEILMTQITQT